MSHVSVLQTELNDKNSLKAAGLAMKCKVEEGVIADLGYNNRVKGDIVFTLPDGRTQVALKWNEKKKTYEVHCDRYGGAIDRFFGKDLSKLKQMFSLKKVEIAARKQGYRATQAKTDQKTGDLKLYLY